MNVVFHIIFLIAILASASAQSINITITGGISPAATLGVMTSYTLTCKANSTNVTWTSYPAGVGVQVGSLTTSGSTSSRPLTLPSPVVLSYAGLYVCTASANGVSTTASYAFNVTVGSVTPGATSPPLTPAGAPLSVSCSFSLTTLSDRPLSFQWNGPNGTVPYSGRISANNASQGVISGGIYVYTSTLTFSTLSSQDNNNMYQCLAGTLYTPYSTQYTPSTTMTTVMVSALTLSPTISGPSCQQAVLQLNCTAAKPLSVVPPVVFSWYRGSGGIFSPLGTGVPGTNVTPQGANVSTLTIAGSSVGGSYVYQCEASVAVPDDVPVVAYATTGVVNFSLYGMVSGLTLQSSGQLVWEVPVVNCNTVSFYNVTMTTYSDGTLVEMGTTTQQNYTLTRSYAPGVPYIATVGTMFVVSSSGAQNTSQQALVYSQELAPSGTLNITVTSINGSTILLSWKPLSPVEARGFVRYYLVTWTPGTRGTRGTTGGGTANLTADTTTFLITGLDPVVTYMVSVSAGTIAGVGTNSSLPFYPVTMATTTVPPAPPATSPAAELCGSLYLTCIIPIVVAALVIGSVSIVMVSVLLVKVNKRRRQNYLDVALDQPPLEFKGMVTLPSAPPISAGEKEEVDGDSKGPAHTASPPASSPASPPVSFGGPVYIKDFSAHVNLMHQDRDRMFDCEFQSIPECQHPTEAAALPCNKSKNRFHNISPYDYNRVLLRGMEGVEGSDYINASFIDVNYEGYKKTHAYIMAQGPMPNTVGDFWRMVFEHRLDTIVMLTQCNEGGKRKCEQYWPDSVGGVIEPFPGLRVTLEEATPLADYVIRRMKVNVRFCEPLSVTHFQYVGWPDFGTPTFATPFIGFIRRVRSEHRQDGSPLVVHCSSGVGRSGVFIILDCMLERLKEKDTVNVCDCFADMRRQRLLAVETLAQYVFIHDALNEIVTCGDTQINASALPTRVNELHTVPYGGSYSGFEEQFELLERVSYKPNDRDTSEAKQQYNMVKNRYEDRVSFSLSRTRLRPLGVQGSDYVNASYINGYKARNAYIAAQAPLMNTVEDFWRMVWEFKSMTIVMLCGLDEDRVVQYWPMRSGETLMYGKMSITLMGNPDTSAKDQITVYKLELKEEKEKVSDHTSVHLIYYAGWPEHSSPQTTAPVLTMALKAQQIESTCMTVVCTDGMGRTGAFITIHAMMERLKTEHVVDFFQFIKSSRAHRQNFVMTLGQYIFCHEALANANQRNVGPINSTLV